MGVRALLKRIERTEKVFKAQSIFSPDGICFMEKSSHVSAQPLPCTVRKQRLIAPSRPVPRVRIPLSPPRSLKCRESRLLSLRNTQKMPVFRDYSKTNRTGENGLLGRKRGTILAFLRRAHAQSGF